MNEAAPRKVSLYDDTTTTARALRATRYRELRKHIIFEAFVRPRTDVSTLENCQSGEHDVVPTGDVPQSARGARACA